MTFGLPKLASFPSCRQKLFRPHASSCGVPFYRPKPPFLSSMFIALVTMLLQCKLCRDTRFCGRVYLRYHSQSHLLSKSQQFQTLSTLAVRRSDVMHGEAHKLRPHISEGRLGSDESESAKKGHQERGEGGQIQCCRPNVTIVNKCTTPATQKPRQIQHVAKNSEFTLCTRTKEK